MNNTIKYDPLLFKFPKGVVTKGSSVEFFVQCDDELVKNIYLMWKDDEPGDYNECEMQKVEGGYKASVKFNQSGHYWYHFKVIKDNETLFVNKTNDNYSFVESWHGEDFFPKKICKWPLST